MRKTRPQKREDCIGGERPCPFISCRYHMLWALSSKKRNEAPKDILSMTDEEIVDKALSLSETCVLDVADNGRATFEYIAEILGMTRQAVDHIQNGSVAKEFRSGAMFKLRHPSKAKFLRDWVEP